MKYLLQSLLFVLLVVPPAAACAPPVFPVPEDIAQIEVIASRNGQLKPEEQAALDSYHQDRDRYMALYDMAYPCPLQFGGNVERLQAENSDPFIEEMDVLVKKWNRTQSLPDNQLSEKQENFVDVPQDAMMVVE